MSLNDDNTRASVRGGDDQIQTFLAHFTQPDATWENFGKTDSYVEFLRLHLLELLHCTEVALFERGAVVPQEFGA